MSTDFDVEQVIRDSSTSLRARFPHRDAQEIERVVREEVTRLADKPVRDYVSVLAERAVKQRLKRDAKVASPGSEPNESQAWTALRVIGSSSSR